MEARAKELGYDALRWLLEFGCTDEVEPEKQPLHHGHQQYPTQFAFLNTTKETTVHLNG